MAKRNASLSSKSGFYATTRNDADRNSLMLPVLILLVAMWLTVMRRPDTPIAKWVWGVTVTKPIDWAHSVRRGHLMVALLITVAVTIIVYWIGRESMQLFAMGAPDIGFWLVSFDIATYVDALVAVTIAASTIRVTTTWSRMKTCLLTHRRFVGRRERKTRTKVSRSAPSNDDEGRWACAA